jgi:hypothetical protein
MDRRLFCYIAPAFILFLIASGYASAQGYPGYPDTIMVPEHGASIHHRAEALKRTRARAAQVAQKAAKHWRARRNMNVARGSSGSVLPTPLPRTPLIPPEGGGSATVRITPPEQSPTIVPGLARPIPNLPHGTEGFQDRASRCAFQQGLNNVPGSLSTQYMGACLQ